MNYNVSVNIFLKDHRIMSYCTTESVDEQSDYYRAVSAKTWRGPNYKVLKQTVLFAYFGLKGRQDHVKMTWGDIQLKSTSGGQT
jgi:hypothetical protein